MTIVTVMIYTLSSNITLDYLYSGEKTRVTGITGGCINRFNSYISKSIGKAVEYGDLYKTSYLLENKYRMDSKEFFDLQNKFSKDELEYKFIIREDGTYEMLYVDERYAHKQEELENLIHTITPLVPSDKPFKGMIATEESPYIVAISPIRGLQKPIQEYMVVVDIINQDIIGEVSTGMGRMVNLVKDLDLNKIEDIQSTRTEEELLIDYTEADVRSYYKLPLLVGDEAYYLEVVETLEIKESTQFSVHINTFILTLMGIIVNIILWLIIKKIVVERIVKVNKDINVINKTRSFTGRIPDTDKKDEIGILTKDINEMFDSLQNAHEEIISNDKKYSTLLECMTNAFANCKIIYDKYGQVEDAIFIECNMAMANVFGLNKERLINKPFKLGNSSDEHSKQNLRKVINTMRETGKPYEIEQIQVTDTKWGAVSMYLIQENVFSIIITDVTVLKNYSDKMQHMANYDMLTGLANRYHLHHYLEQLVEQSKAFAVYFLDLDNFKELNDTLGHTEGDRILCAIAKQLEELKDKNTIVGRLGGDEFIIIRIGQDAKEVTTLGDKILNAVNQKIIYEQYEFDVKTSIGISLYPKQANNIGHLLQYADIAMYSSKRAGGNRVTLFKNSMLESMHMQGRLKEAIEKEELVVYYQPIYDLALNRIVSAEALVRWIKDGEVITPYHFIPLAKEIGCIADIDFMVLKKACVFCKEWHMKGYTDFQISVNMSLKALRHPELLENIKKALANCELDARALKLEITEDEVIDNPEATIKILEEVKKLGIQISLDDFGVGYSSFNHIKMLPIDTLKIDRSLLLKVEEDKKTLFIIRTLIDLAHNLGMDVICEGVESEEQLNQLSEINCDKIQGYFIAQPVEERIFIEYMKHYNELNHQHNESKGS